MTGAIPGAKIKKDHPNGAGKNKSHFSSIEEFCQSNDWKMSLAKACEVQIPIKDSPICKLCNF